MMISRFTLRGLILTVALAGAASLPAQEAGALIDALIRKGILTHQEAEDIRAEIVRDTTVPPVRATAGGATTSRLSVGMRMQAQYAYIDNEVPGAAPVATNHAFLRRMYLTLKAGLTGTWGATMTYDFASGGYDDAFVEWRPTAELTFNLGLRKVNVAHEERRTSGDLRAIERSGVTRYFVESNNGRRLGAGSYRIGAFLDGRKDLNDRHAIVYSLAITNPERNETFNLASGAGDNTNNNPAYWGNIGWSGRLAENAGMWVTGIGIGHLPDQGGAGVANLGRGFDLMIYSIYADAAFGRWNFLGEYLWADIERGASATRDAVPAGFYLQPGFMVNDTFEVVARYQSLDTDGRGVQLGDVVRSAPSAPTMDKFEGWFVGANWYLRGNDLKYQLGLLQGKTTRTLTGAPAQAKAMGVRSQLQLQF